MALFDKLKEVGSKGLDKAKEVGGIANYKLKITSAEGDIKTQLVAIGKKLIEEHPEIAAQYFGEELGKINELKSVIAELTAQIEALKNAGNVSDEAVEAAAEKAE